jgi:single-strand DNA-binding protein
MSGSVNKVILIGNLGKDPRISRLNSGEMVASFSLATSETWRDKASGERKERTEWHNVVVYNENIAKVVEQYCKKGTKVYVEGSLQTRKWQDQQTNAERYTTEIVLQRFRGELTLLDSRPGGEGRDSLGGGEERQSFGRSSGGGERRPALAPASGSSSGSGGGADLDDEIPF